MWEVLSLNMCLNTNCLINVFHGVLLCPGKYWGSTSNKVPVIFYHALSKSLYTNHPIIQWDMVWTADSIVKWTVNKFMEHAIGWTISWDSQVIFSHEVVLQKFCMHIKFVFRTWLIFRWWSFQMWAGSLGILTEVFPSLFREITGKYFS